MRRFGGNHCVPVLLVILALAVAGCGRGGDGNAAAEGKGLAASPGFDPAKGVVRLGVVTPLTGPVAVIGKPYTDGNRVFFDALNAKGGVAGKYKVELVVEDNAYDNPTTIQKYQKLRDQVVLFAQVLGTGPVNAVLPQLRADGLLAAPASLDAEWVGEENLLPLAATAQIQFMNAAHWYLEEGGGQGKTICLVAIENPYGDAGVEGLQLAAAAEGFQIAVTARFKPTDQDFTAPVTQLRNGRCQAVFLTGLPSHTGPILGAAARLSFAPQWIGLSPTWLSSLAASKELLPVLEQSYLVVSDGPQWGDKSYPGMRQMLADIAAHRPDQKPDTYFRAGYAQATSVTALLEKAVELGNLSRRGILEAQRQLGTVSFGGLLGDYTYGPPQKRNPTRTSTIFRINGAAPEGLEAVKVNFASPPALEFSFAEYLK